MAKLTLDVEHLVVESFHTASRTPARGTVVAAQDSLECPADPWTFYNYECCSTHETACPGATCVVLSHCCPTYNQTCPYTCAATCTCGPSAYCQPSDVC
ncbi:MAG TPA: hypothetical protein VF006_18660 [Longimicrobium sp.]